MVCLSLYFPLLLQLLEHGADIDATDKQNCTPLAIAAQYGRAECVIMLVKRGANTEILDMNGDNALHWAVRFFSFRFCFFFVHESHWIVLPKQQQSSIISSFHPHCWYMYIHDK